MSDDSMERFRLNIEKEKKEVAARYELCQSYIDGKHQTHNEVPVVLLGIMKDALAQGYKVWRGTKHVRSNPFMLAKMVRNEAGDKLYQVVIDFWDLAIEHPQHSHGVSLAPSAQFYIGERHGENSRTVNVDCFTTNNDSLQKIEDFFGDVYEKMNCVPYEKSEDA